MKDGASPTGPLRVAVLVDTPRVSRYLRDLLDWLADTDGVMLAGVYLASPQGSSPDPGSRGGLGRRLARLLHAADRCAARLPRRKDAGLDAATIPVQPVPADGPDCDLLVRAGSDDAAAARWSIRARHGTIGLDFALDADPAAGSVGLDESARGDDETGFVLYRIASATTPATVIRHGWYPTHFNVSRNRAQLYGNALRILKDAILRCVVADAASPWPPDPQTAHDGDRRVVPRIDPRRVGHPSPGRIAHYLARTLGRYAGKVVARLRGRDYTWAVGLLSAGHPVTVPLTDLRPLPTGAGRFLADPFVVRTEAPSSAVIFVEEWIPAHGRAHIAALAVSDPGEAAGGEAGSAAGSAAGGAASGDRVDRGVARLTVTPLGPVIQAPHHLSFPFPFRWQGRHYLCPEAAESGRITVWVATDFPSRWEPAAVLMEGVCAADTMLFESAGRWWMLTNLDRSASGRLPGTLDLMSELHLFHADHPLSTAWTPHPMNPLRIDCRGARNAGLLVEADGLFRCGQIQRFDCYGHALAIHRITTLTPQAYAEECVRVVTPGQLTDLADVHGIHTWHRDGDWSVVGLLHRGRLRAKSGR